MEKNVSLRLNGGLAHLARALAWQARGGQFESDILHFDYQGLTAM